MNSALSGDAIGVLAFRLPAPKREAVPASPGARTMPHHTPASPESALSPETVVLSPALSTGKRSTHIAGASGAVSAENALLEEKAWSVSPGAVGTADSLTQQTASAVRASSKSAFTRKERK